MADVNKPKLDIDKVKFEQMIDQYLASEIPLSFLTDNYDLTYPQMRLLINRTISYTKKTDYLYDNYPNATYGGESQDYIAIPHEMDEEYPTTHEERMEVFAKIEELKASLPLVTKDLIVLMEESIAKLEEEVATLDPDDIAKARKIAFYLETADKDEIMDSFEDVLIRNFVTPQEFKHLDEVYSKIQKLEELKVKKEEAIQELKIANRINRKIGNLKDDLTVQNIKLVNFCIRYFFSGIPAPQDEMQQYGIEGLAKAINGFDYTLGYHFSTYAVPTIVHTIERYFKEMMGIEWKDYCMKESIRFYRNMYKDIIGDDSFEVTPHVLAESGLVPYTEKQIANNDMLPNSIAPFVDVQEPFSEEYEYGLRDFPATFDDYETINSYEDSYQVGIDRLERELADEYSNKLIMDVLTDLKPKEAQVIVWRFGLDGGGERSLREIARMFSVTPERIRQIEAKAIRRLRHPKRYKRLSGLLEFYTDVPGNEEIPQYQFEGSNRRR